MIIGIHGKAQAGKDTIGKYLVEKYGFQRFAFADKVKEHSYILNPVILVTEDEMWDVAGGELWNVLDRYVCIKSMVEASKVVRKQYFFIKLQDIVDNIGWEEAKKIGEVRKFLQVDGTEAGRNFFHRRIWMDFLNSINYINSRVVVTDVRFDDEAGYLIDKNNRGYTTVKIWVVKGGKSEGSGVDSSHASEQGVSDMFVDQYIDNNGTLEDLYQNIDGLVTNLK